MLVAQRATNHSLNLTSPDIVCKMWRSKGFFLSKSSAFFGTFEYLCYGSTAVEKIVILTVRDCRYKTESDVYRRQILMYKDDPALRGLNTCADDNRSYFLVSVVTSLYDFGATKQNMSGMFLQFELLVWSLWSHLGARNRSLRHWHTLTLNVVTNKHIY